MNITLNGEAYACHKDTSLFDLAKSLGLEGKRYAIEQNKEIVPKSTHEQVLLKDGDAIEIVQAIGGG